MNSSNFVLVFLKYTLVSLVKGLLYWPLWWYSRGLVLSAQRTIVLIASAWQALALGIWLKNIFVPMYSQYDIASRIISFFMRLIQIIVRSIAMIFLTAIFASLFIIYLFLPALTIFLLISYYQVA